jgi:hypothetical protein
MLTGGNRRDLLHDCEEHKMNDAKTCLRPGWLAAFAAAAAIGLAACGGGSSTPHVASVGSSSGSNSGSSPASGGSATTGSNGNPAQLLQEWTSCERSHGDPGQADPTIDASKVIHVTMPASIQGGVEGQNGQSGSGPGRICATYLNDASNALNGGHPQAGPTLVQSLKFAQCMRANGVPKFPDPSGPAINLGALPNSPTFQNANKVCAKQVGVRGMPGSGPPQPGDVVPTYSGNG